MWVAASVACRNLTIHGLFQPWGKSLLLPLSPTHTTRLRGFTQISAVSATQRKPAYFRDQATPYEYIPLPHSPKAFPPKRRIARRPTPPLGSRFISHATHVRAHQPAALSSVLILVCVSSSSSAWVVTSVASFALMLHSHQAGSVLAAVNLTKCTSRERCSRKITYS
jgi:hypothetical protein